MSEQSATCNMESYRRRTLCGKPALWKHPRWPDGTYCQEHKEILELRFPNNWERLQPVQEGVRS